MTGCNNETRKERLERQIEEEITMSHEKYLKLFTPQSRPKYSPDGKYIVFCAYLDRTNYMFLYDDVSNRLVWRHKDSHTFNPVFNREGNTILFSEDETGPYNNLCTVDLSGSNKKSILKYDGRITPILYSYDQKEIYYVIFTNVYHRDEYGEFYLFSIGTNGEGKRLLLTNGFDSAPEEIVALGDGSNIVVYGRPLGYYLGLYRFNIYTGEQEKLEKFYCIAFAYNYKKEVHGIELEIQKLNGKPDYTQPPIVSVKKRNLNETNSIELFRLEDLKGFIMDQSITLDRKKMLYSSGDRVDLVSTTNVFVKVNMVTREQEVMNITEEMLRNAPVVGE